MIGKNKSIIVMFILFILLFPSPSIATISDRFTGEPIKVGGDNNYPPYEFVDDNDNFRGFNVDIIRAVAIELGLEIEIIPNSWEDTMRLLQKGDIDLIQGMTLTPERNLIYNLTEEIVINSQNIFVLNSTSYISDLKDLDGKRVAIQAEDVTKGIIENVPNIIIIEKVNQLEAIQALISGEVDAFIGNRLTGIYYVQTFGLTETIKIVGEPLYTTKYCMAVKAGDTELLNLLNTGIAAIKSNGTYDKIYKKWFGEIIVDGYKKWKNLLYITSISLFISFAIIFLIYILNKRLKMEIDIRTKEIVQLNNLAMYNDKMQSLGKLSGGIAHELRNPLTSIKAFVDLIPLKIDDNNFRNELMKIVPKEIKRLDDLVGSLLDYSRPRNPKPEKIILSNILEDVLTLLKQKFHENKIEIITEGTDVDFYADESQIKQILINVLLNSIDAIDGDEGKIQISGNTARQRTSIIIKDNGTGIPKEMLDKLFDPFYTSKKTGYGIGLSVTERLIRDNNGEIKLVSEAGQGTIVTIIMPTDLPIGKEK